MPAYTDATTTQPSIKELRNVSQARRDRAFRGYAVAAPATGTYAQGDIVLNSAPTAAAATLGWVCITAGTPGTWITWPAAITQGDMQTAVESRTVPMGNKNLTIDNVASFDVNANLSVVFDAPATVIRHTDTAQAGLLQLRESLTSGAKYLGVRTPTTLIQTYNITLPNDMPTSDDQVLAVGSYGGGEVRMAWESQLIGQDTDNLSIGGDATIDFTTGFDNKRYVLNANAALTLVQPTREARFTLTLKSNSAVTNRTITWLGYTTLAAGSYLPTYVTGDPIIIPMEYRDTSWHIGEIVTETQDINLATVSATWQVDCGNCYTKFRGTGALPPAVTVSTPLNQPEGWVLDLDFPSAQTNTPTYDAALTKVSASPTHVGKTHYTIKRTPDSYLLAMVDQQ